MKKVQYSGLNLLEFQIFSNYAEIFHAVTTRTATAENGSAEEFDLAVTGSGDSERVLVNYETLSRVLDFALQSVVTSHQVHGTEIALIDAVPARSKPFPLAHAFDGFDAFITAAREIPLMVRVADCVPVMLYDPTKKVLAVIHAGWRGTAGGIAGKTARAMAEQFGCATRSVRAGIGPSIGPCCYRVGREAAAQFLQHMPDSSLYMSGPADGLFSLDLQQANRIQLIEAGLDPGRIEIAGLCTACNLHLFFSHRGEKGKAGRFGLIAGLRR